MRIVDVDVDGERIQKNTEKSNRYLGGKCQCVPYEILT